MSKYKLEIVDKNLEEETISLIIEIYKNYDCGGALHIVIDDDNVDNSHIKFCINEINTNFEHYYQNNGGSTNTLEEDKQLFIKCANNLLKIKKSRRTHVISIAY